MRYFILGPLEVHRNGEALPLGTVKQRALLAILLLRANEVVSRDLLIADLWGERPPASAAHSLAAYVSRLRAVLHAEGEHVLLTRSPGYTLKVGFEELDLHVFDRLVEEGRRALSSGSPERAADKFDQALALWRGRPLADVEFEPFAQVETDRLEELRLAAVEERIEADLALGRHAAVLPNLEGLVARYPLRERLRGQLMLALYRSGRQAEALQAYRDGRQHLVEELGLEPGPALRDLERAILEQSDVLELPEKTRLGVATATATEGPPLDVPALQASGTGKGSPRAARRSRRILAVAASLAAIALGVGIAAASGGLGEIDQARPSNARPGSLALAAPNSAVFLNSASEAALGHAAMSPSSGFFRFGFGSLWSVSIDGVVDRVDVRTHALVKSISLTTGGGPGDLAVGEGAVWVTDSSSDTLFRIDPTYYTIAKIRLPAGPLTSFNHGAGGVAVGAGSVWVAYGGSKVARLNPVTGRVERLFSAPAGNGIAVGEGAVWVADTTPDGGLTRIDLKTNTATRVPLHGPVCCVVVGGGYVWAPGGAENTVWKISPQGTPLANIRIGGGQASVADLAYGHGALWVSTVTPRITRVDPMTDATKSLFVGHSTGGIAVRHGVLAVGVLPALSDATAGLRGKVAYFTENENWIGITDPALASDPWQWQLEYATCAKLYNYPDEAGLAGTRVEPEVASAMPTVSADGHTYTITIRSGYRFSPPSNQPVTAQAFRLTIERSLSPKLGHDDPATAFASDIVGVRAYRAGRGSHIAGISAHGRTLTIRLRDKAADLPARLALPYFCAVPVGTPVSPIYGLLEPIPTAGPYYLSAAVGGEIAVLRRNPNYHGPRPHRLEAVVYKLNVPTGDAVAQIERGKADYVEENDPALSVGGLVERRFGRSRTGSPTFFRVPMLATDMLVFNSSRPLFANAEVRRAVNLALNRRALAAAAGYLPAGHFLPPGMPGYGSMHLYPESPDLVRARLLMRGRHGTASLFACSSALCVQWASLIRAELAPIGIRVVVHESDDPVSSATRRGAHADLLLATTSSLSLASPYPDAVAFLAKLLDQIPAGWTSTRALRRELQRASSLSGQARARVADALDLRLDEDATAAPLATETAPQFFSQRVGCKLFQPLYFGVDVAALCFQGSVK